MHLQYFVIFAVFTESMTLNLAHRSLKVINFGGNRKPVYDFIYAVNATFRSISHRFGDIVGFVCTEPIFPYPTPIPAKIEGCSLWSESIMLELNLFSKYSNLCDHNTSSSQTDRQRDGKLAVALRQYRAVRSVAQQNWSACN